MKEIKDKFLLFTVFILCLSSAACTQNKTSTDPLGEKYAQTALKEA